MSVRVLSLQDHFLNSLRRAKVHVALFLIKGVKLEGMITAFDTFSVLLRREGTAQLVYKHSISTIMPSELPQDFNRVVDADPAQGPRAALQDMFLATAVREKAHVTIFLVNGVMLQGSAIAFDQFSVLLERGSQAQLVYKHAISTIRPDNALHLEAQGGAAAETGEAN